MTPLETLNVGRSNGVHPAAMHTLLAVLSDPPMLPSAIAKITGITPAAMTGSLDRLIEVGMIERCQCDGDRRHRAVMPTEKAFDLFGAVIEEMEVRS